jgi:AcrR family transcriptional regulator
MAYWRRYRRSTLSGEWTVTVGTKVGTRPRDRKLHIIEAAIALFRRDGYHQVGIDDIAAAVGVTGGALYRHFRSKQDLLATAITTVMDEYLEVAGAAEPGGLDAVIVAMAQRTVERRDRGALWQLHARDLSPDQQKVVRRRLRTLAGRFSGPLRAERPELSEADADLLGWAMLAVLGSPFDHGVVLGRPRLEDVVADAARAVGHTGHLPGRPPSGRPASRPGLSPRSRREALIATAGRMFREHGYDAVSVEAIGAACGITGPGVYNHFPSKFDLLVAVLERGREVLQLGLVQALSSVDTAEAALEPVVRSYVRTAMRPDGLPGLLVSEAHRLPEDRRQAGRRRQREYLDEWGYLLPLGQAHGRAVVHAAVAVVNSLVLIPHLRTRGDFEDVLVGVVLDILRAPVPVEPE